MCSACRLLIIRKGKAALMSQPRTITATLHAYPTLVPSRPAIVRPLSTPHRSFVTTMNKDDDNDPNQFQPIFQKKRALRSKIRKSLKEMDPIHRCQQDNAIQNFVIEAPWFKSSKSLCAYVSFAGLREVDTSKILSEILCNAAEDSYNSFSTQEACAQIRKNLYLRRVEDRNSNMRMLKISSFNDLIVNSMNILEPSLVDCDGNQREDVMQASEPIDLFILPGLAFDRSGRRLGRSGGYYDMFLKNYKELANKRNWKPPLLVALAYSLQIVGEGAIAVTPDDVPVDAIVSPDGFIPTSLAAMKMSD